MKFLKKKVNLIISLLVIVMIVLMLFSSQRSSKSYIEGSIGDVMSPIQKIIYNISKTISDTYEGMVKYSDLVDQLEVLNRENGELKAEINRYSQLKKENQQLREILNFKYELDGYDFLGGNIIGKNGSYTGDYIVDLGSNDGLENGMIVIANGGLFGMVTSVSKNWSIVSPIINGNISVTGMIQRTNGNQGVIKKYKNSANNYTLKMEYLPINEDIVEGDVVVTSGLGGVYPSNIIIGEVVSIENDKRNLSKSVIIKSHINFDFVDSVFVVLPKNKDKVEY